MTSNRLKHARIVRHRLCRALRRQRRRVGRHIAVPRPRRRDQLGRSTDKSVGGPNGPTGPSAPFAPFEPNAPFARFCARRRRQRARSRGGRAGPVRRRRRRGPAPPETHLRTVLTRLLDDGSRRKQRQTDRRIATMKCYFPCSRRLIIIFSHQDDALSGLAGRLGLPAGRGAAGGDGADWLVGPAQRALLAQAGRAAGRAPAPGSSRLPTASPAASPAIIISTDDGAGGRFAPSGPAGVHRVTAPPSTPGPARPARSHITGDADTQTLLSVVCAVLRVTESEVVVFLPRDAL